MANVKLIFSGTTESETSETELQCFANVNNEIYISISTKEGFPELQSIALDKKTAIRFHRELKKQISFLESEVDNG